jgi:hypothetical protein
MTNDIQQSLMDELGLNDLPQDKKDQLMIKMTETILKQIFMAVMKKLDEAGRGQYTQMIENQASPEEIDKFLREKITDYDQMLEKILADFKAEMQKV